MEILNPSNWNLVHQNTYIVQPIPTNPDRYYPLPPLSILATSNLLLIGGQSSKAEPHWYLAASVIPRYSLSLSGSQFSPNIQTEAIEYKIPLNRLVLLNLKNYGAVTFFLEIKIPAWHEELSLEVWQCKQPFLSNSVEEKLENLKQLFLEQRENIALLQQQLDRIEQGMNTTTGQ